MPAMRIFVNEPNEQMTWHTSSTTSEESLFPVTPYLYERWRTWVDGVLWPRPLLPRSMNLGYTKGKRTWQQCKYLLILVGVVVLFGIIVGMWVVLRSPCRIHD
jgi:hypothetical protein